MEKEYSQTQAKFSARVFVVLFSPLNSFIFKTSFIAMIIHALLIVIPQLIQERYKTAILYGGLIGVLLLLFASKRFIKEAAQAVAVLVNLALSLAVFIIMPESYTRAKKNAMFMRGWATASIHVILVNRFPKLLHKIIVTIIAYVIRFVIILGLDSGPVDVPMILRQLFIDMFLIYANYENDRKDREVFKRFYENREQLLKFKELMAHYFPQSILVINPTERKPLFFNKAFVNMFELPKIDASTSSQALLGNFSELSQAQIDGLRVDTASVREVGALEPFYQSTGGFLFLKEFIIEELKKGTFETKALTLSACFMSHKQQKSFEIVILKVKWDAEDGIALIFNDTTYQDNLTALKVANANKDQVIATVSHELRTPLNGIIGILQIAEKRIKDKEVKDLLSLCQDNAYLLLSLVNSILDLQQIKQGKLKLNPGKISVSKLLHDVTSLFQFQCQQKNLDLKIEIDPDVPSHIFTDGNRLKQILINLIGNALKFTMNGSITVGVIQHPTEADSLEFFVTDTGIGIKEEDQKKLFKMFGKLSDGASVNKEGVGLGLMISNILAEILGGNKNEIAINVTSDLNSGSKFSFRICKALSYPSNRQLVASSIDFQEKTSREKPLMTLFTETEGLEKEDYSLYFDEGPSSCEALEPKIPSGLDKRKKTLLSLNSTHKPSLIIPTKDDSQSPSLNQKGTVLVVDDNAFNLLIAENILKDLKYSTIKAQNGLEAINILINREIDFEYPKYILMDCQMPVMDGFETAQRLTAMMKKGEMKRIPIFALTANNSEEDIKRCYNSGMEKYLPKPLFPDLLAKALSGK